VRTCALGRPGVARIAAAGVLGTGRSAITTPTIGLTITARGATASCPIVAILTVASMAGAIRNTIPISAIGTVTAGRVVARAAARKAAHTAAGALLVL
jgi:hypothetical protein